VPQREWLVEKLGRDFIVLFLLLTLRSSARTGTSKKEGPGGGDENNFELAHKLLSVCHQAILEAGWEASWLTHTTA